MLVCTAYYNGIKRNKAHIRERKMQSKKDIKTQRELECILQGVCEIADRNVFLMLPEKEEDRIEYLKKEISETLDLI